MLPAAMLFADAFVAATARGASALSDLEHIGAVAAPIAPDLEFELPELLGRTAAEQIRKSPQDVGDDIAFGLVTSSSRNRLACERWRRLIEGERGARAAAAG